MSKGYTCQSPQTTWALEGPGSAELELQDLGGKIQMLRDPTSCCEGGSLWVFQRASQHLSRGDGS